MARHADKYALLRTLHHDAAAVHDSGHQLMQTGRLFRGGVEEPSIGSALGSDPRRPRGDASACRATVADRQYGRQYASRAGCGLSGLQARALVIDAAHAHGEAGWRALIDESVQRLETGRGPRLDAPEANRAYGVLTSSSAREAFDLSQERPTTMERYGRNRFGQGCLLARRLVSSGVRFVTVNMFETVFDEITWDIHGSSPFSPIECYSDQVGPMFDHAFSSLIEDLSASGELDHTLVLATGEFGRTPKVNPAGGRDHWPQCWSMLMAGGGVVGGQVVGQSDEIAATPRERPIAPAEVAATIYTALGIDLGTKLPGPDGREIPIVDEGAEPIRELFS